MSRLLLALIMLPCSFIAAPSDGYAQTGKPDGIYIIFDASGSMWQKLPGGVFKIAAAKEVLQDFVGGDFSGYELAFRAYGHRRKGDCRDSELIIPFGEPTAAVKQLHTFMATVNPTGKTPIHYSLAQALHDFGDRKGDIILISDGEETCDADPCELVRNWKNKNVDLKVHVVGLGLEEKARQAMQCIADAAGTKYHDASSAAELADRLRQIKKQAVKAALIIVGRDASGQKLRIRGTLQQNGLEKYTVTSNGRNRVEAGDYLLQAGVPTRNGTLYQPVSKKISVAGVGDNVVELRVVRPPSVKATFRQQGKEIRGAAVKVYQDGRELFKFRWIDEVFVEPGTYEFRSKPNAENDLAVTATVKHGQRAEVIFDLVHTVKATFKMVASGSGIWFRENYELWQGGERKYKVHVHNGARVLPGTYELRLPNKLTPYAVPGIVVTEEDGQRIEVEVPAGHVTVIYQKPDGTRDKDKRCFIGRGARGKGTYKKSGQKHPLTPGRYNVAGWRGDYDRVVFDVEEGKDIEVILKEKR